MGEGNQREVTIAGISAAAAVAVIGGLIGAIPALEAWWEIVAVLAFAAAVLVVSGTAIFKELRRIAARRGFGEAVTAYEFDEKTGVLLKGKIANVSLRVETLHRTIDRLAQGVPPERREEVLRDAGYAVGADWGREFRTTLWHAGLRKEEFARQLLQWSEYDATAGMGRLMVALEHDRASGTAMLINSFLSKSSASFPLNYWFAGYIAGTMDELFGARHEVELTDPSTEARSLVAFRIRTIA